MAQTAAKLVLEPIFEASFLPSSFGFRPKRSAHRALELIRTTVNQGARLMVDLDFKDYYGSLDENLLLALVGRRVSDRRVIRLLRLRISTASNEATNHRLFATFVTLLRDRVAAEDCVQEAYLRAFKAWPRWRADAPAEAWLHRIAINVAVSHRRRDRLREVGEVIRRLGLPLDPDPAESVVPELVRELRTLPSKQAAALVLRHLHGYSNREIAHALGVPERTIASRLAAARNPASGSARRCT